VKDQIQEIIKKERFRDRIILSHNAHEIMKTVTVIEQRPSMAH